MSKQEKKRKEAEQLKLLKNILSSNTLLAPLLPLQKANEYLNMISKLERSVSFFPEKEKDIKQILNIENFEKKNFPLGKKEIKFEEHLSQFLEENERYKKMEEMEIYRQKRKKKERNGKRKGKRERREGK